MGNRITESVVEDFCLNLLEEQGYSFVAPDETGRADHEQALDEEVLRQQVALLNSNIPEQARE